VAMIPEGIIVAPKLYPADDETPVVVGELVEKPKVKVESNVFCAALLLSVAVGVDCLTAIDSPNGWADSPSSLRTSGLVSVFIFASPALKGFRVAEQRFVIAAAVAATALCGARYGNEFTRLGDFLYTAIVTFAGVYICATGGIESDTIRPDALEQKQQPHNRQSVSALCGGLLFYLACRGLRMSYAMADEARGFDVQVTVGDSVRNVRGYSFYSISTAVPLAFGHAVLGAVGLNIGLQKGVHVSGSGAAAVEVLAGGAAAFVAALWASLGASEGIDALSALYGGSACTGTVDVCAEAFAARRFNSANGCVSSLWIGSIACLAYSFAIEHRLEESELKTLEWIWYRRGFGLSLLAAAGAVAAGYAYASLEGQFWHSDFVLIASLAAALVSSLGSTLMGSAVYIAAMVYEEYELLRVYGFAEVYSELTHVTLGLTLIAVAGHVILSFINEVIHFLRWELVEGSVYKQMMATLAQFATSLSAALFLASALMVATTNGGFPSDGLRDGSGKRAAIVFVLQHYVPLLVCAPLIGCRCEPQLLSRAGRALAWWAAVPVVTIVYLVLINQLQSGAPAAALVEVPAMGVSGTAAVIAWASVGLI